jgi:hypothetical protein
MPLSCSAEYVTVATISAPALDQCFLTVQTKCSCGELTSSPTVELGFALEYSSLLCMGWLRTLGCCSIPVLCFPQAGSYL